MPDSTVAPAGDGGGTIRGVRRAAALLAILAGALLLRLPSLSDVQTPQGPVPRHREMDERIYATLVEQADLSLRSYTLRGTPILALLEPANYDLALFPHPPAFTWFTWALSRGLGIHVAWSPILLSLAAIVFAWSAGTRLYGRDEGAWAAFLVAACPVGWFVSQHVWLDNMLIAAVTGSFAAMAWASGDRRTWPMALAGAAFGLALCSKLTAWALLPALVALEIQRGPRPLRLRRAIAFGAPALALGGAWLLASALMNGHVVPRATASAAMLERYPFTALVTARPWHYYLTAIPMLAPVTLFALPRLRERVTRREDAAAWLWCGGFVLGMTLLGLGGLSYQTRYVAPAMPALALMAGAAIARQPSQGARMLAMAAVAFGAINGAYYAVIAPGHADFMGPVTSRW